MPTYKPEPTEEEVLGFFEKCSNWGRWGADDSAGTVNLVTPGKRVEAANCVKNGRAVSIARRWDTVGKPGNWNPAQHFVRSTEQFSVDYIGILFHGYATTHVDALCHVFWEGKMYNGKPASDVTSLGARSGDVSAWSTGITTRGVLLDIPKLRGTDYVALEEPVRGYELLDAAKAQSVDLRPGDAVCVYSGREKYYAANPDRSPGVPPGPGLHADCAPVLKDVDAAILSWDMMDASPNHYSIFQVPNIPLPMHVLTIVQMGMPLLDNSLLEPLAEACAEEGRYEFMLTINPLHIKGGTGSPLNPVAIF